MNIQKTKKNKSLISMLVLALMVLSILLPNFVYAATETLTVEVTKYKYTKDGVEKFQTDGRNETTPPEGINKYTDEDTKKYGPVKFAIYKLNKDGTDKVKIVDNKVKPESTLIDALKDAGQRGTYGTLIEEKEVKAGTAKLSIAGVNPEKPELYAIVETEPSKAGALITTPAEPMVLYLPHYDQEGYIKDLKIAAKNQVAENGISMKIQKIGEDGKAIENAKFELYKGEKGAGTKVGETLSTTTEGNIDLNELSLGQYYLVEKESDKVRDPFTGQNTENKTYMVSDKALNDKNNKLAFEVKNEGIVLEEGSLLKKEGENKNTVYKITNFKTPFTNKKLETKKIATGSDLTYKVEVFVPGNIEDYETFVVKDTRTKDTLSMPENVTVAEDAKDSVKTITKVADKDNAETTFKFDINELKAFIGDAKVGKTLTFTYTMKLADKITGKIENKVSVIFDPSKTTDPTDPNTHPIENGDGDPENPVDPQHPDKPTPTVEIKTFKLTVKSERLGVTGTKLAGVKFYVKDESGRYYQEDGTWNADKTKAKVFKTDEANATDELANLLAGSYTIEVAGQPDGYTLVEAKSDLTVEIKNADGNATLKFKNEIGLPLTGSDQLIILGIVGIAIIATAVAVLRKKENK